MNRELQLPRSEEYCPNDFLLIRKADDQVLAVSGNSEFLDVSHLPFDFGKD